ncbi:hypothetical protein [Cerasicoccus fimbriatus]|uniref:hypothetical protein n=1 Tax=Cerasicoccus fimbriatus TaxID=3014554 RepID=UPI0022B454BD|nr:hypothetical protein [Cerasicoccus sp. TK19100]
MKSLDKRPCNPLCLAVNSLALDAAGVAVVWHWVLGHALGLPVSGSSLWVLGLSVWLVYVGDRWLDARGKAPSALPTQRHRLLAQYRVPFLVLWAVVLVVDVCLAITGLTSAQFQAGLVVLVFSLIYTVGIQRRVAIRRTKELQVAAIFLVGVGAFFWGESLSTQSLLWLALLLALFGLACFVNCILLARWEMDVDRVLGRKSLPLALGDRASQLKYWALTTGVAGLLLALAAPKRLTGIPLLLGLYGFYLLALDLTEWPRNIELRRSYADGGLLIFGLIAYCF